MKGPGAFVAIVIGVLLLWLVISGRATNLSAAATTLKNGSSGAGTSTLPTIANTATVVTSSGTIASPEQMLQYQVPTLVSSEYQGASYVSPQGMIT